MSTLYETIRDKQRLRSQQLGSRGLSQRLDALSLLKHMLIDHQDRWLDALHFDLGKPAVEAYSSELAVLLNEIDRTSRHLRKWLKPTVKRRLLLGSIDHVEVSAHPYGSVLVLSPWNYPLQLALMPVIGALAGGNGVVLKPSEYAQTTSALLAELVPRYFSEDTLYVAEGGQSVAESLTALEWDFVFFTGSTETGRKVYQAAAAHLTPVLLELGGKNPCILDVGATNKVTVREIAWGKFLNAGQSCIAPDTVYVPRKDYKTFLHLVKEQLLAFYGDAPLDSDDYGRIIHQQHFDRLMSYLDQGECYVGGHYREDQLKIAPTIMVDLKEDSPITNEEIFGPLLAVVAYDKLDDLLKDLRKQAVPLVVYAFSKDNKWLSHIEESLESGAFSVNHLMLHAVNPHLPFGGKGQSGMGNYHGYASFKAFTYQRSRYRKRTAIKLSQQFPPYSTFALNAIKHFRKRIF